MKKENEVPVKWLALTLAARKVGRKGLLPSQCPWLRIAGEAGSLEYARNVYDWFESEFGLGHFCICEDEGWWYVEERNPDKERLDWLLNWLGFNEDISELPCRDWNDNEDARLAIDEARSKGVEQNAR